MTRRYIISGGPGSGKTTLIDNLGMLGFPTRREAARKIIEWSLKNGETLLPWKNRDIFDKTLERISISDYEDTQSDDIVFFDGCMLDIVPWRRFLNLDTYEFEQLVDQYEFEKEVFIPQPWEDIYISSNSRPAKFQDSVAIRDEIVSFYEDNGYSTISIPKLIPKQRANFILNDLGLDEAP